MKTQADFSRPRNGADAKFDISAVMEFANRHKITVPVARAVLMTAGNIEAADKAVIKMRGH